MADDHTLFREGLRQILELAPDICVVGDGSTGEEAVDIALAARPDVLLLDVQMPGPGAAETLRRVRVASPRTRVVVLTMHDDPGLMRDLLLDGAAAYLTKAVPADDLLATVRSVCRDPQTVLMSLSRRALGRLGQAWTPPPSVGRDPTSGTLTAREREILHLVADSMSNAQIAVRLRVTPATVKRHLTKINTKLQAVSRTDAVRRAVTAGIIGTDDDRSR